jgi:hypothetical protein
MGGGKKRIQVAGLDGQAPDQESGVAPTATADGAQGRAMGLQGAGGGGNAAALAMMNGPAADEDAGQSTLDGAESAAGGGVAGGSGASSAPAKQHYSIEIRAWIPHARVVDPEEPMRLSDWADSVADLVPNVGLANLNYEFESHYRGDGHTGYDGSVRVFARVDFDWDGTSISGLSITGDTGYTHRDWTASLEVETLFGMGPDITLASTSGSDSRKAAPGATGSGRGTSFNIAFASANPLVMTVAPAINSSLTGTISASGALDLSFDTDMFPSHGLQVIRDGAVIHKEVIRDASGVPGEGVLGAALIGALLSAQVNEDSRSVP